MQTAMVKLTILQTEMITSTEIRQYTYKFLNGNGNGPEQIICRVRMNMVKLEPAQPEFSIQAFLTAQPLTSCRHLEPSIPVTRGALSQQVSLVFCVKARGLVAECFKRRSPNRENQLISLHVVTQLYNYLGGLGEWRGQTSTINRISTEELVDLVGDLGELRGGEHECINISKVNRNPNFRDIQRHSSHGRRMRREREERRGGSTVRS